MSEVGNKSQTFSCPFCDFSVTSKEKAEVLRHVMLHKQDRHPDVKLTEEDIKKLIREK